MAHNNLATMMKEQTTAKQLTELMKDIVQTITAPEDTRKRLREKVEDVCGNQREREHSRCPTSQVRRRPSAARLLPAPTQMALCLRLCLLRLLRRELLRAFATLDDLTPQRRISELRVWSYEPFIVFAPSSSGYTSGQNLEVLYILNNRNNQNISRNYALHIKKLKQ